MPTVKFKSLGTTWIKSRKRRMISDAAERLWVALLLESDSYGDVEAYPDDLLHELFRSVPGWTEAKVKKHLKELYESGLVTIWESHDGKPWAHIIDHDSYQSGYLLRKRTSTRPSGGPNVVKHIENNGEARPSDAEGLLGIGIGKGIGTKDYMSEKTKVFPNDSGDSNHIKKKNRTEENKTVFDHWVQSTWTGRGPQPKLDKTRSGHLDARREEGFTTEDLKRVCDGFCKSPFHNGENPSGARYLTFKVMYRNAEQVEKGLGYADQYLPMVADNPFDSEEYAAKQAAREAEERAYYGDAYEEQMAAKAAAMGTL